MKKVMNNSERKKVNKWFETAFGNAQEVSSQPQNAMCKLIEEEVDFDWVAYKLSTVRNCSSNEIEAMIDTYPLNGGEHTEQNVVFLSQDELNTLILKLMDLSLSMPNKKKNGKRP